jgi:hypothetical protein
MAHDSLFGERIVWSGRCRALVVPFAYRLVALLAVSTSAITLCNAVVVAKALKVDVGGMVVFAAWCATIALGAWRLPIWWRSKLEYIVTDRHVIWRRGPLRRTIDIRQISYALFRWNPSDSSLGDLVIVRAVPTGALRRTLSLTLHDVEAPDRVWALIRGLEPGAPLGTADRPLAQRLDPGERVLWSGAPLASPWTLRRTLTAILGFLLASAFLRTLANSVHWLGRVFHQHALSSTLLVVFVGGIALGMLLLLSVAAGVGYVALLLPSRLARDTRYFVTDSRVLIRRRNEELSLDRSRIAYVIDAPCHGLHDVFLVLDGPQGRALAPSGAFGGRDRDDALRPVLAAIDDADTVGRLLRGEGAFEKTAA